MPAKAKPKKQLRSSHSLRGINFPIFLLILSFAIGFCTHLLITVIFAESKGDGVIHACANKRSGELRIITNYKEYKEGKLEKFRRDNKEDKNGCRENEMALDWNIQGPPGPPGSSGGNGGGSSLPFICPGCGIGNAGGDVFAGKDLSNAILVDTSLNDANLSNVNFSNAKLMEASLNNANLSNTNLENANLLNAHTEGTNWEGTKWKNTTCPDGSNSDENGGTCNDHMTPSEE